MKKWGTDTRFSALIYYLDRILYMQCATRQMNPERGFQKCGTFFFLSYWCSLGKPIIVAGWSTYWIFSLSLDWAICHLDSELKNHMDNTLFVLFLLRCAKDGLLSVFQTVATAGMKATTWFVCWSCLKYFVIEQVWFYLHSRHLLSLPILLISLLINSSFRSWLISRKTGMWSWQGKGSTCFSVT